jgi:hypothetical protein
MFSCCVAPSQPKVFSVMVFGSKKSLFVAELPKDEDEESVTHPTTDSHLYNDSGGMFGEASEDGLRIFPDSVGSRKSNLRAKSQRSFRSRSIGGGGEVAANNKRDSWVVFTADASSTGDFELFCTISKNFASKIILFLVGPEEGQESTVEKWREQIDNQERLFAYYYSNPDPATVKRDLFQACMGFGALNTLAVGGFLF